MRRFVLMAAAMLAAICSAAPALAQSRVALVIANSAYQGAPPLKTTVADAGLIATTLQAAGYDVTTVNDLTKDSIGQAVGAFRDKLASAGPNAVAFVYFAGYGAQLNADSYIVPVDAQINSGEAVANEALPLSALAATLAAVPAAARIIVLDASRDAGFGKAGGQPAPPGLALIGAPPGVLVAYAAAPNAVAPDGNGPNSPFAAALATLMRQPGLDIEQILKGVRVQVNEASKGTQTPWMASALSVEVKLFDAPAAARPATLAPALGVAGIKVPPAARRKITKAHMRQMTAEEAYRTAIEEDALQDYQWFVETHPGYPMAGQVWEIINNRRESILWRRALTLGSRSAYWNYLSRYPNGAHAWSAHNWLSSRGQPLPPSGYMGTRDYLPPGYYDEAIDLPDIVPSGVAPPARVFGDLVPVIVPPSRPWERPRVVIIQVPRIIPPPPLNPNAGNAILVVQKPNASQAPPQPVPVIAPAISAITNVYNRPSNGLLLSPAPGNLPTGPVAPPKQAVAPPNPNSGPQPTIIYPPATPEQTKIMEQLQRDLAKDAAKQGNAPPKPANGPAASVSSAVSADDLVAKPTRPGAPMIAPAKPTQVVNQPPAHAAPTITPPKGPMIAPVKTPQTPPTQVVNQPPAHAAPTITPPKGPMIAPVKPTQAPPTQVVNQPPAHAAPTITPPKGPMIAPAKPPQVPPTQVVNQPPAHPAPTITPPKGPMFAPAKPIQLPPTQVVNQPPAHAAPTITPPKGPIIAPAKPTQVPPTQVVNQPPAHAAPTITPPKGPMIAPAKPTQVPPPHLANQPPAHAAPATGPAKPPQAPTTHIVNQPPPAHAAPTNAPAKPSQAPPPHLANQPPPHAAQPEHAPPRPQQPPPHMANQPPAHAAPPQHAPPPANHMTNQPAAHPAQPAHPTPAPHVATQPPQHAAPQQHAPPPRPQQPPAPSHTMNQAPAHAAPPQHAAQPAPPKPQQQNPAQHPGCPPGTHPANGQCVH
jgi:hypothetical protein